MISLKPRKDEVPFFSKKKTPIILKERRQCGLPLQHKIFVDHSLDISGSEMLTLLESIHCDEIRRICFAQVEWDHPEDPHILLVSESEYSLNRGIDLCLDRLGEVQELYWKQRQEEMNEVQSENHRGQDVDSESETVQMDTDLDDDEDHQLVWVV